MLQNKDIETLRMLFSSHNYVMTTAEQARLLSLDSRLWRKRSCHYQSIVSRCSALYGDCSILL